MSVEHLGSEQPAAGSADGSAVSFARRTRRLLFGPPRRLDDQRLFHKVSLVAILAWVGLGADGLSSSAYGPEEAFRALGEYRYLAAALAVLMATTVLLISAGYTRIIERFPHGGGGYVVATKLLGPRAGLVSGCALLVDYILTVTVSIAAAGDALFSVLPAHWAAAKLPFEIAALIGLIVLNIRGIRESVIVLAPVFFLFVITHAVVIAASLIYHVSDIGATSAAVARGFQSGLPSLGAAGMVMLILHAFSLGGGTYTGIEAVSNAVPIMRHPQAETAKRTMRYMAASLAITATGLLVCYLLWDLKPVEGMTLNAVLVSHLTENWPLGEAFSFVTMAAAAALLVVAAQAGFADGPRVLANMAIDSWVPRRFASLSDRLTTQNGIALVGAAALVALLFTHGDVRYLVVMYSINVFLTFSMSLLGMTIATWRERRERRPWKRRLALFAAGLSLCLLILSVTVREKFGHGGWITLVATGGVIALCAMTRRHYTLTSRAVEKTFASIESIPVGRGVAPAIDPAQPTAAILVTAYGGLGLHTLLNSLRVFPNHFKNIIFVSVGIIDSGGFKGTESIEGLRHQTQAMLGQYVAAANRMGLAAASRLAIGTDPVDDTERLCVSVAREFPRATFITGHLLFARDSWYRRLLHNQTAYALQRRLQWLGLNMMILPARID